MIIDKNTSQSFAYRDVGKGREPGAVSFAYKDVGEGRELGAVSFTAEIVTKANDKIRSLISLSALSGQTSNKTDIVLLIQESSSE